jgi:hypothetical protein
MMAEMQDIESDIGELETVETQQHVEQATQQQAVPDDVPEQFKGKSLSEIAKYALATERRLSKQGQELGEVRRLADELLKSQLMQSKAGETEKPKEVDFFENPHEAVRQQVENHPAVRQAQELALQARRVQAQQAFVAKHPDMQQIVHDPEFQTWVRSSPVRVQLFQRADAFDVAAGDELFSTFKELRSMRQQKVAEVDTKVRDQTMKAATVETGGSGESTKKVYRRADLIRLKMRDPSKYESMQDEIYAAYQEGRVR